MSTQPRPRHTTVAAGLIMGGSLFVVLAVFERVSGLSSLDTREAVEDFLSRPPGDGLGLGTEQVLSAIRVLSMVAGACATATGILGFYVLQRSKPARLGLSVLALPLFLSGMAAGGFVSAVVAAAIAALWMQPTRAWYDGKPVPERPTRPERPGRTDRPSPPGQQERTTAAPPPLVPPASAPQPTGEPRPWAGFGASPEGGTTTAPHASPLPASGRPARHERPGALVWACAITWTASGLVAGLMGLSVLVMALAPDLVLDELRRQRPELATDLSDAAVRNATLVVGGLVVAWCAAAAVLAGLAWRGVPWARVALLVSAALAAALCVIATVGNPLLVVPLVACGATVALLARPEVRAYFGRR